MMNKKIKEEKKEKKKKEKKKIIAATKERLRVYVQVAIESGHL